MSRKRVTKEEFIERSNQKHNYLYDYSFVEYKDTNSKVEIICRVHGVFIQAPYFHYSGQGCPQCAIEKDKQRKRLSTPDFIKKASIVHNNFYSYTYAIYGLSTLDPIMITCPIHGNFSQSAKAHLDGQGCPKCGYIKSISNRPIKSYVESFLKKANLVHKDYLYDYSLIEYKNKDTKIKIICKNHGEFLQSPSNHLAGNGCPKCAKTGFNIMKPAILYYIKIGNLYKIGIANRAIKERYSTKDKTKFDNYKTWEMNGEEAYETEQSILKIYKEFKYFGDPILESGNTELFTCDILNCF